MKTQPKHMWHWLVSRKWWKNRFFCYIIKIINCNLWIYSDNNISSEERIQNLSAADICARSEKAPSKQYEMHKLKEDIKQLIDSAIAI